ncbi:MAG: hypothetical protein K6F64_04910 [Clostridia bacterium]|nr:hypothetical protein [Clostridia bacterium]
MSEIHEYKCPSCGGAIEFNADIQKMKCPYCETEFDMDALKAYDEALDSNSENMEWEKPLSQWTEEETDGLLTYVCNSCGGSIIGDENMAASACPYCGNPVIVMGNFKGDLKPEYIIPFKVNKESAKNALMKHYNGKRLLPKSFRDQNHIDKISGVYVPFWLFDATVDTDFNYKATKEKKWEDSKNSYTETSYYSVTRGGTLDFKDVPVDGSSKFDDTLMESIEPFDFSDAVEFQTAYLAGYLADRYDVDSEETFQRANERIKNTAQEAFMNTVQGYESVTQEGGRIDLAESKAKYTLLPVWLLNTSWNGKNYTFAMNGQTGKFVGDLPVDKSLARKWMLGIAAASGAGALLLSLIISLL